MKRIYVLKYLLITALIISGFDKIAFAQTQTRFLWADNMGGTNYDAGSSVAIDDSGNVYTTGYFQGTGDFNPGKDTFELKSSGYADIFITKLNSKGNFVWAKKIGGSSDDYGESVVVDNSGNVYVTGSFEQKVDFDPGSGTYYLTALRLTDVYVVKLNNSGGFVWAKQFGGIYEETGHSIALDDSGNVYTTGTFRDSVDFDPGTGKYIIYTSLNGNIFVSKLNNSGDFVWAKMMGNISAYSSGNSIALDDSGNVFTTGSFYGTADFDPGSATYNLTASGGSDIFISKLTSNGKFAWALKMGSANYSEGALDMALDKYGNIYTTGTFDGTSDFDPGTGTYNLTSKYVDIFISKLSPAGKFIWASRMGDGGDDRAVSIAVDDSCAVYIAGNEGYIMISKLDSMGKVAWTNTLGGASTATSVKVDKFHNVYSTGYFGGKIDFDNGPGTFYLISKGGGSDIFIQKIRQCRLTQSTISPSVCTSYKIPSGKRTYLVSGTYKDTLTNVAGCDSIITIKLTILKKTARTVSIVACQKYLSPSKKYTWSVNGTYMDTIPNKAGCDSTITIKLTINTKKTSSTIYPSACYNYTSPSKKYSWSISGTYMDTIPNAGACDSVITINLTIKNSTYGSISPTVCNSYTSPSKKFTWFASGNYSDTIKNKAGCDSIVSINLKIKNKTTGLISPSVCKQFTSPSKKYVWTKNGTYTDTIKNVQGCDSIITVKLTIDKTFGTISPSVCYNYKSPSAKYLWTKSGTYTDTIKNIRGCDSIITIKLTIIKTYGNISPSACYSYKSPSSKYTWLVSGTYIDTIKNKAGCDSIILITLKINKGTTSIISPTACKRYTSPSKKFVWSTNGTYYDTIKNKQGCDSAITIKLTINKPDVSVINNSPTLTANANSAAYQWLNCNNSSAISGAIYKSFTAKTNGSYAVKITQNSCADTSICFQVSNAGLANNIFNNTISIYPNPTNGEVHIEMRNEYKQIKATITNVLGEVVLVKELSGSSLILNIDQNTGVYFVSISTADGQTAVFRVVKY